MRWLFVLLVIAACTKAPKSNGVVFAPGELFRFIEVPGTSPTIVVGTLLRVDTNEVAISAERESFRIGITWTSSIGITAAGDRIELRSNGDVVQNDKVLGTVERLSGEAANEARARFEAMPSLSYVVANAKACLRDADAALGEPEFAELHPEYGTSNAEALMSVARLKLAQRCVPIPASCVSAHADPAVKKAIDHCAATAR